MSFPLEDYALIGDGETAALVCRNGSIDWLCWPRFDSDACLAALLGNETNGRWLLAPHSTRPAITRQYRPDTLILETTFSSSEGELRVIDFMPPRDAARTLVRVLIGIRGVVPVRMELGLRFDYGRVPPWIEGSDYRMVATVGPDLVVLHSEVPLKTRCHDISAEFDIAAGERRSFVLRFGTSNRPPPPAFEVEQAERRTEAFWRAWIVAFAKTTDWPEPVRRSLITLKALINAPTGGIIAAPTTSLPEVPGGTNNWDYRYCWLRDAAFTITALLNAGYPQEASFWRDWILRAVAGSPEHMQVMYRLDGGRHLHEWTVPWLSGYRFSSPVRVGNAAFRQQQHDIYGEVMDVLDLAARSGIERTSQIRTLEDAIVVHLESSWNKPGHGIWESRGEPRHYVYSKVMAWTAVDRWLKRATPSAENNSVLSKRLQALRQVIHAEVCQEGFDSGLGSFVQHYGSHAVDASLLLIPALGFLPVDDRRVAGTIERIESELIEDGLVYRTQKGEPQQGAFLACNCWLADCRQMQNRKSEARAAFERLLAVRNDVGLLSEEYDLLSHRLSGNFPQALTHLALVNTALNLSGPVLQRGGG